MMKLLWAVMTLFACAGNVIAAPYFHDTDLVDIPTGKSMEHGVFNVGTFIAFRNERALPRAELAVKLDFGLFNRLEIGIITIKYNDTSFLLSNFLLCWLLIDSFIIRFRCHFMVEIFINRDI